jgi:seryl-tRNA synthetase
MSGAVARLHRALAQFMLDVHTEENGLTEVNGPVLVRPEVMYGTGQLPKFGEDSYETTNGWWLIPTSEVSLTNIVAGHIVDEDYLPRRYTAHSQCFRSEAGSAGRDTAGMLRQHQFEKVEMVSVTHPDHSDDEQKRMLRCAEGILERSACPTAPSCCAPATWASARGGPTTSRSGCRGRTPIARSPRSRPAAISRPGA